jgi:large subunit ribosomal protein L1
MSKLTKRQKQIQELIDKDKEYTPEEATDILKKMPHANFDETIELYFILNVDSKQSDQLVRGTVILPHGTGQKIKVLALTRGEDIKKAQEAGADYAGADEYIEKISSGWLDFDAVIATPGMMKDMAKLGKILGPRGLMPSPKAGTVTENIASGIKELKQGKVEFKSKKDGNIYLTAGKVSFDRKAIVDNVRTVINAIKKARPKSVKGNYIKKIYLSTSMGGSLKIKK